jgi:diguanylate cyclase (GGDEF)-like protein
MGDSRKTDRPRPDPLERWLGEPQPRLDGPPAIADDHAPRLLRLASDVARAADESEAALLVAEAVTEWLGARFAAIYLVGLDRTPELAALAGCAHASLPSLSRVAGDAISRGRVVRTGCGEPGLAGTGARAAATAAHPLRSGNERVGALVVGDASHGLLGQGLLDAIVEFAGLSITNVRRLGQAHAEARIDGLTGLGNRRAFDEQLEAVMPGHAPSAGPKQEVTLVVFDLDDFKAVNDRRGHPAGDEVLRRVARTLLAGVRATDAVFRIGGDEFALVIEQDERTSIGIAQRVCRAIAEQRRGPRLPTVSAGVAALPADTGSKVQLLDRADLALYAAKAAGKNTVVPYSPQLDSRA